MSSLIELSKQSASLNWPSAEMLEPRASLLRYPPPVTTPAKSTITTAPQGEEFIDSVVDVATHRALQAAREDLRRQRVVQFAEGGLITSSDMFEQHARID
jgi:hypothetical protein